MLAELLLGVVLLAAQGAAQPSQSATPPPDPELLEFLGSFETDDGEWIDPLVLAEVDIATAEQQTTADQTELPQQARDPAATVEGGGEQP